VPAKLITTGLDRLIRKAGSLSALDMTGLLLDWEDLLDRDNEAGILAGIDGYGRPITPVKYRPKPPKRRISATFVILNRPNDNPTTSWYRTMDGPALAPRRKDSRSIKNFVTAHQRLSDRAWVAYGAWKNVLDPAGRPFLPCHFRGEGRLPVRDLAHVRPNTERQARSMLQAFVRRKLKEA